MGTQLPPKRDTAPHFRPMSIVAKRLYASGYHALGTEVGLSLGDIVLDGDSAPPSKGAQQPPPLLAHVYCGQTAGWIKIPLGTDVGLGI